MIGDGIAFPRRAQFDRGALATVAGGVAAAATGGYLLQQGSVVVAAAFCASPLVVWLFARPAVGVVLLGASLPVLYDLTGGRGGFHLAVSDVLLTVVGAAVLVGGAVSGSTPSVVALRPLKPALVQYLVFLALLLALHLSVKDVAQTGQRVELFLIPLVVGAFAALAEREVAVLKAYVVAATLLAVLWAASSNSSLGQKNPVGQLIGNGIILLVGVRSLRRYAPLSVFLVPGLFLTASRGAVIATAVGLLVVLGLQRSRGANAFGRLAVICVIAFVAYSLFPVSVQDRLTTFAPGRHTRAAYAVYAREQYAKDARQVIAAHPAAGVGVGNYLAGDPRDLTQTNDPHNVLLLQAAEGGYGFAVSFVVLIGGVLLALRRSAAALVPAAAGIFIATFAHGLVDVYWVRVTPVLAWLLVGMVCGEIARHRTESAGLPSPG